MGCSMMSWLAWSELMLVLELFVGLFWNAFAYRGLQQSAGLTSCFNCKNTTPAKKSFKILLDGS